MNHTTRSVLIGAAVALVLVAAAAALMILGIVEFPEFERSGPDRLLVIATAPEEDDALSAPFAFVFERGSSSATLLDTDERVVVSGTSATSAREAYPFVGGAGVARALAGQTGGTTLDWLVLPPDRWSALVDEVGGLVVDLPADMSVYREGELIVLEKGRQTLSGAQAVALASATGFLDDDAERERVQDQLAAGLSSVISSEAGQLDDLVSAGAIDSSLDAEAVGMFTSP